MNDNKNIIGCYVSTNMGDDKGKAFRQYIWGDNGLILTLKKLNHEDYGVDLTMILFQFYVNPIPYEANSLKEIESYRRKEKSIGIPIIVTDENFFNKSEGERYEFIKNSILQKLDLLAEVVRVKKIDTKVDLLKSDLQKLLT